MTPTAWTVLALSLINTALLLILLLTGSARRPAPPAPAPKLVNRCVAADHIVLSWPTPDPQSRVEQAFKTGPIGGDL